MAGGGGALLSASVQVVLDGMASRDVLTLLRGLGLNEKLLRELKMKLLSVKAALNDAEAKQFANSDVKNWVDEVKDAVYDAEDLLDDMTAEVLRCKIESGSDSDQTSTTTATDQVRNENIISGEAIRSRIEELTDNLGYLVQEKDVLGLKDGVAGEILSKRWPSTCLVDESAVYGRDGKREEIIELLLSHNSGGQKISVISLVGMGGLGKTTLTQLVYNDRRVEEFFDLKAWVCVSHEFDLIRITKTIIGEIRKESETSTFQKEQNSQTCVDLNQLQVKLKERLCRKKFLLVLDDVWNENYSNWDMLQTPFTVGLNGSKIIVTTRSDKVASVMRSIHIHHLEELSFEDSWSLFAKHAFEKGDSNPYPKLEEIGREIVKKCKGLPLAAKTIGGALYSELRVEEWENLLNNEVWDLPNDEILPALRLSYAFLPPHLKRCFAYCSIFPKDYEFEKQNLVLLWMAEGFLQQSEAKKTIGKIGDEYFYELLSRSFFQKSSSHESYFVMHDLINDLAQLVSRNFCVQLKDGRRNHFHEKLRHLSYFRSRYDQFERFEALIEVNGLRTFLPLNLEIWPRDDTVSENRRPSIGPYIPEFYLSNRVLNDTLMKVRYLRVLSLCYYKITYLPDSIGNLKHLRYLDLSYTVIKKLPESICTLYNLQTLILYFCKYLVELPTMMCKLISLCHLDIRHSGVKEMPSQIGRLRSLQNLSTYRVGKQDGTRVGELRDLFDIGGSLHIQELQNVVDVKDASEANLVGKQYLDELKLEWGGNSDVEQKGADLVLNNLQPHSNLKGLTIYRYNGSRFPDWLRCSSIQNMVSLRLWCCTNVSVFPPLGQLPSLKHLYVCGLRGIERVGPEFYGTDSLSTFPSFASLEVLSFIEMENWREWVCFGGQNGDHFPFLKKLYIQYCPKLVGALPNHLPLLTELDIRVCNQLVAPIPRVPAIRRLSMCNSGITQWKEELSPLVEYLSIENSNSMETLLEEEMLQGNASLQYLSISNCSISKILSRVCLPTSLKSLHISRCMKLEFFLTEFFKCHLPCLNDLVIDESRCNSLLSFPLGNFPKLSYCGFFDLDGLESLSISISDGDLTSLSFLAITGCSVLVSIELVALNISHFFICGCKNLKRLLHKAACFQTLGLYDCPELIFPIQDLPSSLTSLSIKKCDKLTSQVDMHLQKLASLTTLKISGLPDLISIHNFGLRHLSSLQNLKICHCPKLQCLTEEQLPTNLSALKIKDCPLLKDQLKLWTRSDDHYVAKIPCVVIDDQVL